MPVDLYLTQKETFGARDGMGVNCCS